MKNVKECFYHLNISSKNVGGYASLPTYCSTVSAFVVPDDVY
jgi:hypothetical protein